MSTTNTKLTQDRKYCKTLNVGVIIFSVFTIHDLLASIKFSAFDNATC